jgi:hypothetical protein
MDYFYILIFSFSMIFALTQYTSALPFLKLTKNMYFPSDETEGYKSWLLELIRFSIFFAADHDLSFFLKADI